MDSFTFVQSQSSFHKSNTTIRSIGPQFTKPRKIGSIQLYTRRQKLRSSMPLDPRISMRHLRFTCTYMPPHACRRMWRHWWCHLLLWFDAFIRFNLHLWPKSKPPTQKKKKKKALTKVNIWLKVKIFKTDLSHSIFRVHFDFGICFFIQDLGIVQMVQFPESLLLHKS